MRKRSLVTLSILVIAALVVSGVLFYKDSRNKVVNKLDKNTAVSTSDNSKTNAVEAENAKDAVVQVTKSEEIQVRNNTVEYDLKASMYQNSVNETFLKVQYYLDGTGVVKEIGEDKLPELKDLFNTTSANGNSIVNMFLNSKKAKAYLIIERENQTVDPNIYLYDFNLKDSSVKKVFDGVGKNSELRFNNNSNYLAFNCITQTVGPHNNFLQVVNCDNDELIIKNSLDGKGVLLGGKKESGIKFDYSFLSWNSNASVKLKEIKYLVDKSGNAGSIQEQNQLIYDIDKNLFVNTDGSLISDSNTAVASTGSAAQVKPESEAIKALRNYYQFMSTEQYSKANELLDDKFKLKLKIFKQFGIEELTKSDMDVNNMSLYGSLFKTGKLQSIVNEKLTQGNSTVYFYLSYSMGESDEIVQPLVATLVKSGSLWRILSVSDGNESESPFKK